MIQPSRLFASGAGRLHARPLPVSGRRLRALHAVWGALVLLTACVFMANLVLTLGHLQRPCVGVTCAPGDLTPGAASTLERTLGLSMDAYAAWSVALALIPALVWFVVAGVIVWRK